MHLFLTSSPCDDNVPEGVDLPCIFFERNGFAVRLRHRVGRRARLTVVAADPGNHELNDEMTMTFASCFAYHGMRMEDVSLCDDRSWRRAPQMIRNSDVVLLGGGHVPTQSAFFDYIQLRQLLRGYPGVVMGISAGSMNCASIVYAQPEMPGESLDPNYRRFIPGLGLTDVMILPHYQKEKNTRLDGRRLYEDITYGDSMGHSFLAIPDGSYVLAEDGKTRVFGEAHRIADGEIEQICGEEEAFEL